MLTVQSKGATTHLKQDGNELNAVEFNIHQKAGELPEIEILTNDWEINAEFENVIVRKREYIDGDTAKVALRVLNEYLSEQGLELVKTDHGYAFSYRG